MTIVKLSSPHDELDFAAAAMAFEEHAREKEMSGELITSAWHLYSVETLRERHNLRFGNPVPTDVFIFGKGEPDDPSCTKVGGRPFWPANQDWPCTVNGSPYQFLAQFNFANSMDIIEQSLPAPLLLLLTDPDDEWLWGDTGLSSYWLPLDTIPNQTLTVPSTIGSSGPFFGVRHRTADFPEASHAACELDISQRCNLQIISGTKIGGVPHFIQGSSESRESFICQLGSIQAAPNAPFPWINQQEPLGAKSLTSGVYAADNRAVFGDMGSIYFFKDANGNISHSFECY